MPVDFSVGVVKSCSELTG